MVFEKFNLNRDTAEDPEIQVGQSSSISQSYHMHLALCHFLKPMSSVNEQLCGFSKEGSCMSIFVFHVP